MRAPTGNYRKVSLRIWNDAKFRSLSWEGKLVFLYVLTCPAMTSLGAMRHSVEGMALDTGLDAKGFREWLRELFRKGLVNYSEADGLYCVPNFIRHNPPNPNIIRSWGYIIHQLPECELLFQYLQHVKRLVEPFGEPFTKALPEPFHTCLPNGFWNGLPNGMSTTETETETETKTKEEEGSCPELSQREFETVEPDPVVLTFPTRGSVKTWNLTESMLREYRETYEGVDVLQQCKLALQWCKDNATQRKTASGMKSFLTRWLNRVVNRSDGGGAKTKHGSAPAVEFKF